MIIAAALLLTGPTYFQRTLNDGAEATVTSQKSVAEVERCVLFDSGIDSRPVVYKTATETYINYPGNAASRSMILIKADGPGSVVSAYHGKEFAEAAKRCGSSAR